MSTTQDAINTLEDAKKAFADARDGFDEVVKQIDDVIEGLKYKQDAINSFERLIDRLASGQLFENGENQ